MLIFFEQKLAFLAVPKTGTTAIELALRPKADIIFARNRKHTTALRFQKKIRPFLQDMYELRVEPIAVMRDPIDQIGSWYRYLSRPGKNDPERNTKNRSFDEFVEAVTMDEPPLFASIGSQYNFLTSARGRMQVRHLFAYEDQPQFRSFLEDRFGEELYIKQRNVSPKIPLELSPSVEAKLRVARHAEFALYDRLMENGGTLHNPRM